ncbi:hypothetical protein BKA93DRAFT_747899 [Sparassis latifolia]|uniref:DUF7918 domain-containing protein n=1 Tax=Sparassis crispa TaxID=139825 RepID=A0A401GDB2_9APHY|nr:hypothetical protein SCP_0213240 [Sparassis crispa]GBE80121.1 hypothetical protein SCP_0213240 [Sparassis crispa]
MPLELGGIRVGLVCDATPMDQYATQLETQPNGRTRRPKQMGMASCYVPSVAGKTFSIAVINMRTDVSVSVNCYLDGRCVHGMLFAPGVQHISHGVYVSETDYRPYRFADLQVTDDEAIANPKDPNYEDLGMIEIQVLRVRQGKSVHANIGDTAESRPVHERSKKAGTHRVSFGNKVRGAKATWVDITYIDSVEEPFATFKFFYRPRTLLQAQGIIPTSPASRKGKQRVPDPDSVGGPTGISTGVGLKTEDNKDSLRPNFKNEALDADTKRRIPDGEPSNRSPQKRRRIDDSGDSASVALKTEVGEGSSRANLPFIKSEPVDEDIEPLVKQESVYHIDSRPTGNMESSSNPHGQSRDHDDEVASLKVQVQTLQGRVDRLEALVQELRQHVKIPIAIDLTEDP